MLDISSPKDVFYEYHFKDTKIVEAFNFTDKRFVLMLSHDKKKIKKEKIKKDSEEDDEEAEEITEKYTLVYALDVVEFGVHKIFSIEGDYE